MCGIAGFFAGCEMSRCYSLPEVCKLSRHSGSLENWYQRAGVRRAPRRILDEDDLKLHLFPEKLAPLTWHPLVRSRDAEIISDILTNHLYRYLDFTYHLEILVVNDVSKDIALGHTAFNPSPGIRRDALKIYCDEGYHALFSYDLFLQVQALSERSPVLPEVPSFLNCLHDMLRSCTSEFERRLMTLFFVIVSETLITSSLLQVRKDHTIPAAVRDMVTDHAGDEANHHAFYIGLMFSIWTVFDCNTRLQILSWIPQFIYAFIRPDKQAIVKELCSVGFSIHEVEIIFEETYPQHMISSYARETASALLNYLHELEEFNETSIIDIFQKNKLLVPHD